jgi:hypothetical protein
METTMPTYTAEFRTDADYAYCAFNARSPQDALKQALAFYDERTEELIFEHYDDSHSVNEIALRDADGKQVALAGRRAAPPSRRRRYAGGPETVRRLSRRSREAR